MPWLLLVDGLEEILAPELRQRAISALSFWSDRAHYRLLATSRPLREEEVKPLEAKGLARFTLLPFDNTRVRGLANSWFSSTRAGGDASITAQQTARLLEAIQHGQLNEFSRIPLAVSMLCVVRAGDDNDEFPQSRYDLYEQYVGSLLEKQLTEFEALPRLREVGLRYPGGIEAVERLLEEVNRLLSAFALEGLGRNRLNGGLAEFSLSWTRNLRPRVFPVEKWIELVMEVLRQSGMVIGDDMSHRTIGDFLAARQVVLEGHGRNLTPESVTEVSFFVA